MTTKASIPITDPQHRDYMPDSTSERDHHADRLKHQAGLRGHEEQIRHQNAERDRENELRARVSYGRPPGFGDDFSAEVYRRSVRAARDRQTVAFAIAPSCEVVSLKRGRLTAGQEITVDGDLSHDSELMRHLVSVGVVISIPTDVLAGRQRPSPEHTHVVCGRSSLLVGGKLLVPGESLSCKDLAFEPSPEVPERPAHLQPNGMVIAGSLGQPARPGSDGSRELKALEARSLVRRIAAADRGDSGPQAA